MPTTAAGPLLIGVEDGSLNVRGAADPWNEKEPLADFISERINPRRVPQIEILPWRPRQGLVPHSLVPAAENLGLREELGLLHGHRTGGTGPARPLRAPVPPSAGRCLG